LGVAGAKPPSPAPPPAPPPAAPAVSRADAIRDANQGIDERIGQIQSLRAEADRQGQGVRRSCIEEKLKRAQVHREAALKLSVEAVTNERSWDMVLVKQLMVTVLVEEARACVDIKAPTGPVFADRPDNTSSAPNGPPSGVVAIPPLATPIPTLDRPPLASTY
jgi:hypothetical protein